MSTITLARTVQVPAHRAYEAWTDAAQLATWWWPHLPDTAYEVDARPGGTFRISSATAGLGVRGEFVEVDPPSLLRFTWIWVSDGEDAVVDGVPVVDDVAVTFIATGPSSTEVTVRHTSVEHVAGGGAKQGWGDCLDRYESALTP